MNPRDHAFRFFIINAFLLLAVVLFVPGCAEIPYRLEPPQAARLDAARAKSVVSPEKVSIEVMASTYGAGFGLIGALVDSGVNKGRASDAERRIVPLRDQTQDLEFRARFWEQLGPAIQELEWPKVVDVETAKAWTQLAPADVKDTHLLHSTHPTLSRPTAEFSGSSRASPST